MGNCLPATKDEIRDVKKEVGDVKKMIGEMKKVLEDLKKWFSDTMQYQMGCYYRALQRTWKSEPKQFLGAAAEWKDLRQKDKAVILYYNDPSTRESENVRYSKANFTYSKLFPADDTSMAYLIPSDPSCSLAWLRALSIVTGIDVDKNECPILCTALRDFVEGTVMPSGASSDEQVSQRVDNPLKSWHWNFLMLRYRHRRYFDQVNTTNPLIITPIWDPKNEWRPGMGYKLMVSADPESYKWLLWLDREAEEELKWFGTGTPDELQTATDFLALTVRALADLLIQHGQEDLVTPFTNQPANKVGSSEIDRAGDKAEKHEKDIQNDNSEIDVLQRVFESIEGAIPSDLLSTMLDITTNDGSTRESKKTSRKSKPSRAKGKANDFRTMVKRLLKLTKGLNEIHIPVVINRSQNEKPILTVDLGIFFEGRENAIPDPFLVVLKAAASWSAYNNERLLPVCEVYERSDKSQQSGSHGSMSSKSENMRPLEIVCSPASISSREDDDTAMSLSESITGSPGDGLFDDDGCLEPMPAVSPCSAQAVEQAVNTP
ncbi:hypothetical protein ACA910_006896 [Epithemia clementina (nom. ined.)]